jgi:hypothetical protein
VGDMVPARKGCESWKSGRGWFYGNQVPFSPKEDLVQGKVEHAPRLPNGINTTSWASKEGWSIHPSIHQRAANTKKKHRKEADGRRKSSSCLGDVLSHALAIMVGPVWWIHGGVPEPMPWLHQDNCAFYIDGDINHVFSLLWSTSMIALSICVASICF